MNKILIRNLIITITFLTFCFSFTNAKKKNLQLISSKPHMICMDVVAAQRNNQQKIYQYGWTKAKVLKIPKGRRPMPTAYLTPWYMAKHLIKFSQGGSWLVSESILQKYGRQLIGRPDGQFIMPKYQMDHVLRKANGNINIVMIELGIPKGAWHHKKILRIDVAQPQNFNIHIPSGNEIGANAKWLPAGKLPLGYDEAIINQVPQGAYKETPLNLN